ncbi:MAG: magnesium/cobalt transporter CorA [Oceanidesulfovibrio sp.]
MHHNGMFDLLRSHSRKAGRPPGQVAYVGPEKTFDPFIECTTYSAGTMEQRIIEVGDMEQILQAAAAQGGVAWVRLVGMHDPSIARRAGEIFGLHPLQLEDALNTAHRPSLDEGEHVLFATATALAFDPAAGKILQEHVALALTPGRCLTIEENPNNPWNAIYPRLKNPRSRMRRMGADYLFSCLLDTLVDNCFLVVDEIAETCRGLEDALISENSDGGAPVLKDIYGMRKELLLFQTAVRPMHEIAIRLVRDEQEHFADEVRPFLRDVRDHAAHVRDATVLLSTLLDNLAETAISLAGLKLNAVMRVLTVIATIFIPLTFLAGVYGMNFQNMPELNTRYGYFVVLGAMLLIALAMVVIFRKRRWI